jgi:hypothetical protein
MNESGNTLRIYSDEHISILNENHLFEVVGLTQINEEELSEMFPIELSEFLKNQIFLECTDQEKQQPPMTELSPFSFNFEISPS